MTPFLAELEQQLRGAAEREVASGRRRSVLIGRHRFWSVMRAASAAAAVGLAILVFGLAVVLLHHAQPLEHSASPKITPPTSLALPIGAPAGATRPSRGAAGQVEPGSVRIAATGSDLDGGLPWAVEMFRTTNGQTCLLAGRDDSGRVGVIGEDGAFGNDGRFHPYTRNTMSSSCGQTDGDGHAFIVIREFATPASGADQDAIPRGCQVAHPGARAARAKLCPAADERQLEFGLLGPDATSVTYTADSHTATTATGSDGAFIVVGPPVRSKFAAAISDRVMSGMVSAIHYRSGAICRPRPVTRLRHGSVGCRPVGYVAPSNLRVTSAEVRTPVTATVMTARRWCYNNAGHDIACDERVPAGYHAMAHSGGMVLLQWSWVARVAAAGPNAGYEYAIKGGPPCGGGQSSSGVIHAHLGEKVIQQSLGSSPCAQRDTISVEYRTNVGPGGANFATPPNPGHDGQPLVGSTTIYVPR